MNDALEGLRADYVEALRAHLGAADEASLERAYELGRRAIEQGLGVVHLASIHTDAVAAAQRAASSREGSSRGRSSREGSSIGERERIAAAAAAFHLESLSPFEMTLRGYSEANQTLRAVNARLERAKEATERANAELESFSFTVAHDLRAPLRRLDGFSRAVLELYADKLDARGHGYLEKIRASSARMGQLVDDLLQLSRVPRAELTRSSVDVSSLARRILDELVHATPERSVEVAIAEGLRAEADPRLLEAVLTNLLGNALKFTSGRAHAHIQVGADAGAFFVRDDGAGFDARAATGLFRPFQRFHATSEFEGTGVGLATVQRIVERHGGKVWAESQVGQGATFFFTLAP